MLLADGTLRKLHNVLTDSYLSTKRQI